MTTLRTLTIAWLGLFLSAAVAAATPAPAEIGIPCGKNVCTRGLVCCNASCGTCTKPGDKCLAVICPQTDKRQEDAVGPRVRCGLRECLPGQRCCNPSCGYCVYPREVCLPQTCPRSALD